MVISLHALVYGVKVLFGFFLLAASVYVLKRAGRTQVYCAVPPQVYFERTITTLSHLRVSYTLRVGRGLTKIQFLVIADIHVTFAVRMRVIGQLASELSLRQCIVVAIPKARTMTITC